MGRSNRKSSEASLLRGDHWSDVHPDRKLWSPSERAQARQTPSRFIWEVYHGPSQETYEKIGGQPAPLRSPAVTIEDVVSNASDSELLGIVDALESQPSFCDQKIHALEVGYFLVNPDDNYREYGGLVRLSKDAPGKWVFEGVTQWGPSGRGRQREKVAYRGDDISAAARAVNEIIDKKLQKGYQSSSGGSGHVDWSAARKHLEDLIIS